jgi:dipeptidyl aminopeptidase/acylaminoacyl peptidase
VEYNRPNIRIIGDGDEVVWYSDRSGWGHLELYDAQSGALKNVITSGDWLVQDIHHVDTKNREIYFTAGGREYGRDPYYRHLYKASLDGGKITLLTDVNADHMFAPEPVPLLALLFSIKPPPPVIRPDLGVFVDNWSTVDQAPVTELRSTTDGSLIATLETADASALYAAGWQAPVRQAVKAADGVTDIYTVHYAPLKDLPGNRHPVIDSVYGGPQVIVAPRNFTEAYNLRNPGSASALARLGFAVVITDGRGTPLRSNAFRDAGYTEFTQVGIDDHIAAIEQLATQNPEMDTTEVGIYGWSWGGTFSAQAILSRPDFYDVAVSGAGVYDYAALYPGFESFTGIPVYADGSNLRGSPEEKPGNWEKLDITSLAANLQGHLMLVYGDMDENVPQHQAFRLIDALIKANKPYDLLYLPNRTHSGGIENYPLQRKMDYFVEHLLHTRPPLDATIERSTQK